MKKWIPILFSVLTILITTPVMAANIKVETQNSFISPKSGSEFTGPQTVTIQIQAGDLVPGYDTYCEVIAYSGAQNGLKVLEQEFSVTEKGQIITTTLEAADIGTYTVYTSTKYYVNGFINYANSRNMYYYFGQTLFAGDSTSFKIIEKTEPGSSEESGSSETSGNSEASGNSEKPGNNPVTNSGEDKTEVPASSSKKTAKSTFIAKNKTFKAKVKTKKYTVILMSKKGNAPIKNAKVSIKVKGKTYKAKTNKKGKATFKITKLKKKGTYTATIKFAGNESYKKASKKVKIIVK